MSCSFLKNVAKPTQMPSCISRQIQKLALFKPSAPTIAKFGKTEPGPRRFGAVARPMMVATEPMNWAAMREKVLWKRVIVWSSIIPKPTPWRASSTPSHSQSARARSAAPVCEPTHGM